jgi:hypothetical protein
MNRADISLFLEKKLSLYTMGVCKGWVSKRGLGGLAPPRILGFLISILSEKVIKRMKH